MVAPQNVFEVDAATGDGPEAPISEAGAAPTRSAGRLQLIVRRFVRSRSGLSGLVLLLVIVLAAILGPMTSKWGPNDNDFVNILTGPGVGNHILGTDATGRDVMVRTLTGLRISLVIGFLAAILTTALATLAGTCAGYFGKWVGAGIVWVTDLFLVLPSFLVLAILSPLLAGRGTNAKWYLLGLSPSLWIFIVLLSIFGWMVTGRVVRGMTLSLREREYISAAKFMGVPARTIIRRHLIPNIASILIVDVTINVGVVVVGESALSFFGFGVQPPKISLGVVLSENQTNVTAYPYTLLPACFMLIITLLAVNLIGDALRDAIDPTSGSSRL